MPTYEYACTKCGHQFEVVQSFSDDALTKCPECRGKLRLRFRWHRLQGQRLLQERQPRRDEVDDDLLGRGHDANSVKRHPSQHTIHE